MGASQGFQTTAAYNPAPGVEGDFASTNPRATVLAGPGGLVAGDLGAVVGRFGWTTDEYVDFDGAPAVLNTFNGSGPVAGFVHREQQGLIEVYLQTASMLVPAGFPITAFSEGDFWVKNYGTTQATPDMKAYANFADGSVTFAASGNPTGPSATGSSIAAENFSVTGSILGNVLTVIAVGSGTVYPGATISGTNIASGTLIVSQLSGTAGGVGTYSVSIPEQNAASTTVSGTYGLLTVGTLTTTPVFAVGNILNATGSVVAGTTVTALVSGTGGSGSTLVVNNNTGVTSQTISAVNNVETKWYARSSGLAGETVKISSWPQG